MVLQVDVIDGESKSLQRLFPHLWLQLALPHRDAVPAHLCQLLLFLYIPFLIAFDFLLPKVSIRFGQPEVFAAIMPMPKAAVDKHTRAVLA